MSCLLTAPADVPVWLLCFSGRYEGSVWSAEFSWRGNDICVPGKSEFPSGQLCPSGGGRGEFAWEPWGNWGTEILGRIPAHTGRERRAGEVHFVIRQHLPRPLLDFSAVLVSRLYKQALQACKMNPLFFFSFLVRFGVVSLISFGLHFGLECWLQWVCQDLCLRYSKINPNRKIISVSDEV